MRYGTRTPIWQNPQIYVILFSLNFHFSFKYTVIANKGEMRKLTKLLDF